MKKIFTIFFATLLTTAVWAQFREHDPYITKTFSNESVKEVLAETSGGSISVEGGSDKARVEVYIQGNNGRSLSKAEIEERLAEDYKLSIGVTDGELQVIAEPKNKYFNWRRALNISFKLYVPQNVSTELNTSGGSISMKNLTGTHDFATSGGSLSLDKLSGKIKGRTSGGSIHVSNTKDLIDLGTSGGGIEAENCSGKITLSTSGGSISLHNLNGTIRGNTSGGPIRGNDVQGELTVHTSGGSIDLHDLECSVDASTSGGNIDIDIDKLQEYVTIHNSGGNIHVTLPANKGVNLDLRGERINLENMSNFNGDKEDHKVEGTVNGGGIPVRAETSGRVTIAIN